MPAGNGAVAAGTAAAATTAIATVFPPHSPRRVVSGASDYGGRVAAVEAGVVHHAGDVHDGAKHDDLPRRFPRFGEGRKRAKDA